MSIHHPTVVIGRGIVGLVSALRLAEKGKKIMLIGRKNQPTSASLAATGVSAMRGLVMPKTEIFRQKLKGHQQLPGFIANLERITGISIPHRFAGVYEFFGDEKTYRNLRKRVYHRHPSGLFTLKCLNFEQTRAKLCEFSSQKDDFKKIAAFFYPHDGWFDPGCLLMALEQRLTQLGVTLVDEFVEKIAVGKNSALQILASGGGFAASAILVAAGAESENLLRRSGIFCHEFSFSSGITLRTKCRIKHGTLAVKNGAESLLINGEFSRFGAENIGDRNEYSDEDLNVAKEQLIAKYQRLCASIFTGDRSNESSLIDASFSVGVRAKIKNSEDPWIGFAPFLHHANRGVFVATGMHKSGYYIALPCAEKVVEMMG
jgi:glycine/D-amino acid oxidase-like deaminating enzyme